MSESMCELWEQVRFYEIKPGDVITNGLSEPIQQVIAVYPLHTDRITYVWANYELMKSQPENVGREVGRRYADSACYRLVLVRKSLVSRIRELMNERKRRLQKAESHEMADPGRHGKDG